MSSPVIAQHSEPPPPPTGKSSSLTARSLDFRTSGWLADRKVVNSNGEVIADVSDFILDRGWGRINHIVVKSGTTLGMGGRAVAIPFGAFSWDASAERFILAATPEQLKTYPEFSAESWKAAKTPVRDQKESLRQRLAADASGTGDPYSGSLDTAKHARFTGQITDVSRVKTSNFGEHVEISVLGTDGVTRRIALGPSWYVNASPAAPLRDDDVSIDTLALPRDADHLLAATSLTNRKNDLQLRSTDGSPAWMLTSVDSGGTATYPLHNRYLALSDILGAKVDCRGSECGKVHEVIVDRASGEIGFISIDPNTNFLGFGDTKRLVPWSVVVVATDGSMRIDASKEMVLASPETPADKALLNSGTRAEQVYKAFSVPAPRYEVMTVSQQMSTDANLAWSARGPIMNGIEKDSAFTLSGKVIDVTEVSFGDGIKPAHAVKIQPVADGTAAETVLLGPLWYMENQRPVCKSGDTVKVEACRTTVNGRKYWIARSVDCKDARVVLLDSNNVPAWSQR